MQESISPHKDATVECYAVLSDAIDNEDFETYRRELIRYCRRFPRFDGLFNEYKSGDVVHNPIFSRRLGYLRATHKEDGREMLERGRAASDFFKTLPMEENEAYRQILSDHIKQYEEEIAFLITCDMGKPIALSRQEIGKGRDWFDHAQKHAASELAIRDNGKIVGKFDPLGVVQVIGAYNYPWALSAPGLVGALPGGNAVIIAAPLKAPLWIFPFMQAVDETNKAFLRAARAEGKSWADAFGTHASSLIQMNTGICNEITDNVDMVHFVGSKTTASLIKSRRGDREHDIFETGGSNVVSVMESALQLFTPQEIAEEIYGGFGPATGQRCTAPRFVIYESGAEAVIEVVKRICEEGPALDRIGNPLKSATKIGPLVDANARQAMEDVIDMINGLDGRRGLEGACYSPQSGVEVSRLLPGTAGQPNSQYVRPTVVDLSHVDMNDSHSKGLVDRMLSDEIFAPMLFIVEKVKGVNAAIEATNRYDKYKLSASIYTGDAYERDQYTRSVKATSRNVNIIMKDLSPTWSHGSFAARNAGGPGTYINYVSAYGVHLGRKIEAKDQGAERSR